MIPFHHRPMPNYTIYFSLEVSWCSVRFLQLLQNFLMTSLSGVLTLLRSEIYPIFLQATQLRPNI